MNESLCQDGYARMPSCMQRPGMLKSRICCWRRSSLRTPRPLAFVATWKAKVIKISMQSVWQRPKGPFTYHVCKILGLMDPIVSVTLTQLIITLICFSGPPSPTHCGRPIWMVPDPCLVILPLGAPIYWLPMGYPEGESTGSWRRGPFYFRQNLVWDCTEFHFDTPFPSETDEKGLDLFV